VDGTERPNAIRTLKRAHNLGLLEHTGSALRVIVNAGANTTAVPPRSDSGPNQTTPGSDSDLNQTTPGSVSDLNQTTPGSDSGLTQVETRIEPSDGNDSNRLRETEETEEKERGEEKEGRTSARKPSQLDLAARVFWGLYEVRYELAYDLPVSPSRENLAAAEGVGSWLGRLRTGDLTENARRLLDGFFAHPWGKRTRHDLRVLAPAPEGFFARQEDSYMYPSADEFGPPTDLSTLPPLPPLSLLPLGAAE